MEDEQERQPLEETEASIVSTTDEHETESMITPTHSIVPLRHETINPTQVIIPALGVDAPITPSGLNEDRQMEVPDDPFEVGWFSPGTKPGGQGSAVLAGHVDSRTGPAVFFELDQLELDDVIEVIGENGEQLTFIVTKMTVYPYDDAPIDEIFGYTSDQRLNLITCTGEFDQVERTHRERLVVTADLLHQ